ncbi:MotA/TolQ/ExbB proton channel family protein, partial [Collimonas humicola]
MSITRNRLSALAAALMISAVTISPLAAIAQTPAAASASATASAPAAADAPKAADTAAASLADTPTPPPAPAAKETVDNPYGLDALWKGGDFVARGTLIILVLMSMGSWYIIITKLIEQVKLMGQAQNAKKTFWKAATVEAGIAGLKPNSAYRFIAQNGSTSTLHHDGALLEQIDLNTWVTMSIQRSVEKVQSRLQDGLAFLATVG